MQSIIDTIDPKNPSDEDLMKLKEELGRLKQVDIRTVKKEDLVELSEIKVDTKLPKLERVITYIKQVRNPYCYLWHGTIIKVSFKGERSITEHIKDALFCGGPSWPDEYLEDFKRRQQEMASGKSEKKYDKEPDTKSSKKTKR